MGELQAKVYKTAKDDIDKAQKDKFYYDKKHADTRVRTFISSVLLKNSKKDCNKGDKLKPRWLGPY